MSIDVLAIYCGECDSRVSAPTRSWTNNLLRDTERSRSTVLEQEEPHYEEHGPERVLTCADLHEMAGINPLGTGDSALVRWGRGMQPTCPYEVHLLGGYEPVEGYAAVRADLLLPHWRRGCVTLERAMERMEEDVTPRDEVDMRAAHVVSCRAEGCEFERGGLIKRHAIVVGWHHAAREHPVGEVTADVVGCLACETFDVVLSPVADGLPSTVGPPEACACEEPAYWGRRLL